MTTATATATTTDRPQHYHTNRALADASLSEARRRNRPDLAGDIYCRALHEARDGNRDGYTTAHAVRLAAGHVLQDEQRQRNRLPAIVAGDAIHTLTGRNFSGCLVESIEFAADCASAINARQAVSAALATIRRLQAHARAAATAGFRGDSGVTHSGEQLGKPHQASSDRLYSRLSRLATLDRLARSRGDRLQPVTLATR